MQFLSLVVLLADQHTGELLPAGRLVVVNADVLKTNTRIVRFFRPFLRSILQQP